MEKETRRKLECEEEILKRDKEGKESERETVKTKIRKLKG